MAAAGDSAPATNDEIPPYSGATAPAAAAPSPPAKGACAVTPAEAEKDAASLTPYLEDGSLTFVTYYTRLYGNNMAKECAVDYLVAAMQKLAPDDVAVYQTGLPRKDYVGVIAAELPDTMATPIRSFVIDLWRSLCTHVTEGLKKGQFDEASASHELLHYLEPADNARFVAYCEPRLKGTQYTYVQNDFGSVEVRVRSN
jgi:hypothetical protein